MTELTNQLAVSITKTAVLKLGWFFRTQHESDQGIDAQVEKCVLQPNSNGQQHPVGTGRLIAVQIKGGNSQFDEPSEDGWWFRFDEKKKRLWLGHALPVIVALINVETEEIFWQRISAKTVISTGQDYKVNVPRAQTVASADGHWTEMASDLEQRAEAQYEYSLLCLPPGVQRGLSDRPTQDRAEAALLAMHLAQGRSNARAVIEALCTAGPSWMQGEQGWAWGVLARYANDHEILDLAAEIYVLAAGLTTGAAKVQRLVAAAVNLTDLDRPRAIELIALAEQEDDDSPDTLLLLAIARTVTSGSPSDAGPLTLDPLLVADTAHVRASDNAQRVLAMQARRMDDLDGAVAHARVALAAAPDETVNMAVLAQQLSARGSTRSDAGDLDESIRLLKDLIAHRQPWAGPVQAETEHLATILLTSGRYEAVLRNVLPPPLGSASNEAPSPRLLRLAAVAARLLGRADIVTRITDLLPDAPVDQLTRLDVGALNLPEQEANDLLLTVFDEAVNTDAYEDIARLGVRLARGGMDVSDQLGLYVDRSIIPASFVELVQALVLCHTDLETGLVRLRALSTGSSIAAQHLLEVLANAGRFQDVAEAAQALYENTRSAEFLVARANALIDAGGGPAAVVAAQGAISLSAPDAVDLARLLTFLGGDAAEQGQWDVSERHLDRVVRMFEHPSPAQVWRLISVQLRQGRLRQAARVYADHRPPVRDREAADLWLRLHSHQRWDSAIALEAYALAERFDDPRLSIQLLSSIVVNTRVQPEATPAEGRNGNTNGTPTQEADPGANQLDAADADDAELGLELERRRRMVQEAVPAEVHRQAFELINTLVDRHGERTGVTVIRGEPEDQAQQLRQRLQEQARSGQDLAELLAKVHASELPLGLLAGVLGKGYASIVLQRVMTILVASSPDDAEHDLEVEAARVALGQSTVVDSATAVTLTGFDSGPILGQFLQILATPATMIDLHRAAFDTRSLAGSPGSLAWDAQDTTILHTPLTDAEYTRLWERAGIAEELTDRLTVGTVTDRPILADLADLSGKPAHTPWADPIELAGARQVPLWSDDLGLRRLARTLGISTFGTPALLDAIRDIALQNSKASDTDERIISQHNTRMVELAQDFIVDLPLADQLLYSIAESDGWHARAAAAAIARAAWWRNNLPGSGTILNHIYGQAREYAPADLPAWQYCAMHGAATALHPGPATHALALIALMGFGPDASDEERASGLRRARQVARQLGYPDPAGGLQSAAQDLAESGLVSDPADLVRRVLRLAAE